MKTLSILIFCAATILVTAAEKTLFQSNFAENKSLQGWTDVHQKSPPKAEHYKIADIDGQAVLQTPMNQFGISHKLASPLKIDASVKSVTLKVTLRQPETTLAGYQIAIALSSRATTAADSGQAFWKGRDSGIIANGYIHNLQAPNFIAYQLEGERVRAPRPQPPFGVLSARNQWVVWTLKYDHVKKQLEFFNTADAAEPWISIHQADLTGIMLNTVWLGAWGTEYRDAAVSCETE